METSEVVYQRVRTIGSITGRIEEISSVAASIAAAVEQQGTATQEIVRNVAQAAMGAGEVLAAASELSRQSEHLSTEVGGFLANVRAAFVLRPARGGRSALPAPVRPPMVAPPARARQ